MILPLTIYSTNCSINCSSFNISNLINIIIGDWYPLFFLTRLFRAERLNVPICLPRMTSLRLMDSRLLTFPIRLSHKESLTTRYTSFFSAVHVLLSRFYLDFILILSRFYSDFLKLHFIQILSRFYPNFRKYLDKIKINVFF